MAEHHIDIMDRDQIKEAVGKFSDAIRAAADQIRSMAFSVNTCVMATRTFSEHFRQPGKNRNMVARLKRRRHHGQL